MKHLLSLAVFCFALVNLNYAQVSEPEKENSFPLTIVMDFGLMIGHSSDYYPTPFTSNFSVLGNLKQTLYYGVGVGAEVLGKTFIPVYADVRYKPFKSKPLFLYNKLGYSFALASGCAESVNYYYNIYQPHPNSDEVETNGGLLNEFGLGVILKRQEWNTSLSLGYRYMQTQDIVNQNGHDKTYDHYFTRLVFRLGFWF